MKKYMNIHMLFACFMGLVLAVLLTPAMAGDLPNQYQSMPGGNCKVAGVNGGDANNKFDSRAIYSANTGTKNVFAICMFGLTPTPIEGGVISEFTIGFVTLDSNVHPVTCTAVVGSLNRYIDATYSSKTGNVSGNTTLMKWDASDFGGMSGQGIPGSAWASVTCNLPPNTGIGILYAKLNPSMR